MVKYQCKLLLFLFKPHNNYDHKSLWDLSNEAIPLKHKFTYAYLLMQNNYNRSKGHQEERRFKVVWFSASVNYVRMRKNIFSTLWFQFYIIIQYLIFKKHCILHKYVLFCIIQILMWPFNEMMVAASLFWVLFLWFKHF